MPFSPQAKTIKRISLSNRNNMQVIITDFGARILSIRLENAKGELLETTLNHLEDADILNDDAYKGATCGRVSNRISQAQYYDGEHFHTLVANEGKNTLHGGAKGFSDQNWLCSAILKTQHYQEVTLTLASPDGDQGFSGNLTATVTYRLDNKNRLSIFYKAKSDKRSPINMCNHAYFTLGEDDIYNLQLKVNASHYLPINVESIPTGEISLIDEIMDFNTPCVLSSKLNERDFDDCYVLTSSACKNSSIPACVLSSKKHNIDLEIYTNQVGLQVYTGNYLPSKHSAIALEAQGLVDAVNQVGFETDWVGPDLNYAKEVHYQYKVK